MSYQSSKATLYDITGNPVNNIGADNTTNSTSKLPVLVARANTAVPTWTDGYMVPLSTDLSGSLRITGTITATSAAVSATGAAPPASATYIGGSVTTAAPSYTTGTMNALSLTTTGLLRIDGSGVTQPISAASLPLPTGASTETTLAGVLTTTAFQARINTLGQKTMANSTPVVLASDQTVIPVSQSGTWTVQPGNTANTTPWLATINQGGNSATVTASNALKVDGSAVTQPVSGTVTANIGTTNGLALDATLAKLTITQGTALGTNTQAMVGGSVTTAAPTYTTGQISPISLTTAGAVRIDGSGVTQPVSGTVTANAGTGNFTVVQATAANLRAQTASESTTATATGTVAAMVGGAVTTAAPTYTTGQMDPLSLTTAGALRIDGSGVTQPVSGTVTANIGTTNGLALDATLAKLTITQGTALGTNTQAMVGGSVTTAAPTYTTGQISPLSLTTAGALRIDGSGVTQPVSGTVTANQGGAPWSQNVTQFGGVNISTGTGASGTGIPRVTVANDSNILATQSGTWTVQPGNTANTTPWLATINQGGNSAAVKAASTAAVATDPALVVAISPNNTISVGPVTVSQSDTTATGTLNALNATASVALAGTYGSAMQLLAGTLVGTIVPEVSVDNGTTWVATFFDDPTTGNKVSSIVFGSSNTAQTRSILGTSGSSNVRVRVSAFTSGTATCNMRATSQDDPTVFFDGAAGSALAPTVAQVGGSVTTAAPTYTTATMNALSLTTAGALRIDGSAVTQPVSGTVTSNAGTGNFNNASVGTTAAAGPGSATYVGAAVTTNAPAYTTGQMDPLSLTTAGLLRIDGVYPINATTPTTDGVFVAGAVTTAAPTYTTGQMSALSLLTTGALRIDNSSWIGSTAPTVGSKTSANSIPVVIASDQGAVTVAGGKTNNNAAPGATNVGVLPALANAAAPSWTEGNQVVLSTNLAGDLRSLSKVTDGTNTAAVKAASTAAVAADPALVVTLSPNSHSKDTTQPLYGTNNQTVTVTLASLANAGARASTAVSNTTNLYDDVMIFVKITTAAAAVSATGYVNVYGYGTVDGGTTYPEAITGTDAGVTLTTPPNLVILAQINANTNGATKTFGPFSFCRQYGVDRLPASWGVVIVNQTGAAFNATAGNHAVIYQGVNGQLV